MRTHYTVVFQVAEGCEKHQHDFEGARHIVMCQQMKLFITEQRNAGLPPMRIRAILKRKMKPGQPFEGYPLPSKKQV
jgi:hypothetical protein